MIIITLFSVLNQKRGSTHKHISDHTIMYYRMGNHSLILNTRTTTRTTHRGAKEEKKTQVITHEQSEPIQRIP